MKTVTTKNPIKILWYAILGLFTKSHFSSVNFFNFLAIILSLAPMWGQQGLIPMGVSMLIVSVLSAIFKWRNSHVELVSTGVALDPLFYLITIAGGVLGAFETFMNSGQISEFLGPKGTMYVLVGYSILLMWIRTAYTNQTKAPE